jgi:predicted nucleic acid-binding protein
MKPSILIDTGPLVALLSRSDPYQEVCAQTLAGIKPPLLVCWPVMTETQWLLRDNPQAMLMLSRGFQSGLFCLQNLDTAAIEWIADFLTRYSTMRAQLADAALVYLAEKTPDAIIFTLDRRDFSIYRTHGNKPLQLIPEWQH